MVTLSPRRVRALLGRIARVRVLVVGDVMLDQFIWGRVSRISPEAPVPVVDFERESFMPGGAANVARNLTALGARCQLVGVVGRDPAAGQLRRLLRADGVDAGGLVALGSRHTTTKTRIVAGNQQVTRLDRETRGDLEGAGVARLLAQAEAGLEAADGVILGDYGKGAVSPAVLDLLRSRCRQAGRWISLDPKPVHSLEVGGLSLLTPNRKEAFELAGEADTTRSAQPLQDRQLMRVADKLMRELSPALLLVTLGELGMLLCRRGEAPFHIPTVAREVYDVSGAGDTVIASFTAAILAGAAPVEAAIFSNHAAGVVVGKFGTATVTPAEVLASFRGGA